MKFTNRKYMCTRYIAEPASDKIFSMQNTNYFYCENFPIYGLITGSTYIPMICDMIKRMSLFHGRVLHEREFQCKRIPLNENTLLLRPNQDAFFARGFHYIRPHKVNFLFLVPVRVNFPCT